MTISFTLLNCLDGMGLEVGIPLTMRALVCLYVPGTVITMPVPGATAATTTRKVMEEIV